MNARITPMLLALSVLTAACGEEFSNTTFDEDARFLAAAPRTQTLRLEGPAPSQAAQDGVAQVQMALSLEDTAELYRFTRSTTLQLNRGVFALLRDVDHLVEVPPSERSEGRRQWGPFTHPLDPLESRFVMVRDGEGFAYALERRPNGSERDWGAVVAGRFDPDGSDGDGTGSLTFDLDMSSGLTGQPGRGLVEVQFERRGLERSVTMQFHDYAPGGGEQSYDAVYFYRRDVAGGEFEYAFVDEQGQLIEVRSRWRQDGAGRADARVHAEREFLVSECWGTDFGSAWRIIEPGLFTETGDADACAFESRELPTRVTPPTP
jgi:hypothetical protein